MTVELQHAYCTTDQLREQFGDLVGKKLSEGHLNRAINAASRAVDNYTGRRFWADVTPQTLTFDAASGDGELWLDQDIASTTGLVVATDDGTGNYATVWAANQYRLWPYRANTSGSTYGGWWMLESNGQLRWDVRSTAGILPVQITARFGWSFVPPEVQEATILKAAHLFKRKDSPFGVEQFGDIAAVQITRKDADVVELLWPYVRDMAMVG